LDSDITTLWRYTNLFIIIIIIIIYLTFNFKSSFAIISIIIQLCQFHADYVIILNVISVFVILRDY